MKRDMDLIREIMLVVESEEHGFAPDRIKIEGYSQEQIGYHACLLKEAGLVEAVDVTCMGDKSPDYIITRLTWAGHEFLDSARDKNIWNQAKDKIGKIGGAALQIWIAVLTSYIQKQLGLS